MPDYLGYKVTFSMKKQGSDQNTIQILGIPNKDTQLANRMLKSIGVPVTKYTWSEPSGLYFKAGKSFVPEATKANLAVPKEIETDIPKEVKKEGIEIEIPKIKEMIIAPKMEGTGTLNITPKAGSVVSKIITPEEAYSIKVYNQTSNRHEPIISRTEMEEAKKTGTSFVVKQDTQEDVKRYNIEQEVIRETAKKPMTEALKIITEEGLGLDTAIRAVAYAIDGKIGSGEWSKMREEERIQYTAEALEATKEGKLVEWVATKTAQADIVPIMAVTGTGMLGKTAQMATEAAFVGMTGYQGIETTRNPTTENIVRLAAMSVPMIAAKAAPKVKTEIGKLARTGEITEAEAIKIKSEILDAAKMERNEIAKQIETAVKKAKPEMIKQEIKWRMEDYKTEIGKMYEGYEKEIVTRYIEEKAKQAIKHISKLEKEAKKAEDVMGYQGGGPITTREMITEGKLAERSKRIAEIAEKRRIKNEFREKRLYEQPYEGEWGIESGLKTLRKGKEKEFDLWKWNEKMLKEETMRIRQRKRQERRIAREEREEIKGRKKVIRIEEEPRTKAIREEAERIVQRTMERRKPEIEIWKPKEETAKGKEMQSGRSKMMIRTEEEVKAETKTKMTEKARTEQKGKQMSRMGMEYITKAEQRYIKMLAMRGMLKTMLIGKQAYAITPKSILASKAKGRQESKSELMLVPIAVSRTEITQKMRESVAEIQKMQQEEIMKRMSRTRAETQEMRRNRILWKIAKERKEREKEKRKKGKTALYSIDDPLYRLTGRSKYSDIMNIMLKQKRGHFVT